ncbi:hypothetical protein RJT34_00787 [Clitoria ternatea]|uniref:Germin-like protein n=1 Tax=Clitoria ternatea TaxID=43366 RepID=A0AAN9KG66_CLITE
MGMKSYSFLFLMFFIVASITNIQICLADCDNVKDTCPTTEKQGTLFINGLPCKDQGNTSAHDFKSMELSKAGPRDAFGASVNIVNASTFPGLNSLGLSIGRSDMEVDGIVNLHNHPRATEMVFVWEGTVVAGFLDTQNKLFQKSLKAGDVFVIPKGLFHFFLNRGVGVATVFSVFNSQNPGVGSLTSGVTLESLSDSQLVGANDFTSLFSDIIYSQKN